MYWSSKARADLTATEWMQADPDPAQDNASVDRGARIRVRRALGQQNYEALAAIALAKSRASQAAKLREGCISRIIRVEDSAAARVGLPWRCKSALQAAQLRLIVCFLHHNRLAQACPVELEAGRMLASIAMHFRSDDGRCSELRPGWMRYYSKRDQRWYWFNIYTSKGQWDDPLDAALSDPAQCAHQLRVAVYEGDVADAEFLLSTPQHKQQQPKPLEEPLVFVAADRGHVGMIAALARCGENLDGTVVDVIGHSNGYTALMKAAEGGKRAVVKALLASGAAVDLTDKDGNTALARAMYLRKGEDASLRYAKAECARLLVEAGAKPVAASEVAPPAYYIERTLASVRDNDRHYGLRQMPGPQPRAEDL